MFPAIWAGGRARFINKTGLKPYKGIFSLLIVVSVVMMVSGWLSIEPVDVYQPPVWGRDFAYILILLAFILFVAAKVKTNIKRIVRHPQLTGLVLWSIGHLLVNGENRSLVLFIGLGIWAILEIILINRRNGSWQRPGPVAIKSDLVTFAGGILLFVLLFIAHPYFSGASLIP